jgi:hypothetical protein
MGDDERRATERKADMKMLPWLDKQAIQGEWGCIGGRWDFKVFAEGEFQYSGQYDGSFVCTLVNAYRRGDLVPAEQIESLKHELASLYSCGAVTEEEHEQAVAQARREAFDDGFRRGQIGYLSARRRCAQRIEQARRETQERGDG